MKLYSSVKLYVIIIHSTKVFTITILIKSLNKEAKYSLQKLLKLRRVENRNDLFKEHIIWSLHLLIGRLLQRFHTLGYF